nr:MAG TPA: ComZ [Caudoviricetes sp.]
MNMEKTFYKSYKELVSEYFGIDYQVGENVPKLSKQLSKKGITYTQEELQAFSELLLAVFSDSKELVYTFKLSDSLPGYQEAEVQGVWFCSEDCASQECVWSEWHQEYILLDDASCCEQCWEDFYAEDMEEGSDGCLYCSDCIHEHLEEEEDELDETA